MGNFLAWFQSSTPNPNSTWIYDLQKRVDQEYPTTEEFNENNHTVFEALLESIVKFGVPKCTWATEKEKKILLLGDTCSGKSMIINLLAKLQICKVGFGKIASSLCKYEKVGALEIGNEKEIFNAYELISKPTIPAFLDMEFLSFLKRMDFVVLVYANDPDACKRMIRILDSLGVRFICVRNKLDEYDEDLDEVSIDEYKNLEFEKIKSWASQNPKQFQGLYFISARNQDQRNSQNFDWDGFVDKLNEMAN